MRFIKLVGGIGAWGWYKNQYPPVCFGRVQQIGPRSKRSLRIRRRRGAKRFVEANCKTGSDRWYVAAQLKEPGEHCSDKSVAGKRKKTKREDD